MENKKSFFEKITGTKSFDDAPQQQKIQNNFTTTQKPQIQETQQIQSQPQKIQQEPLIQKNSLKQEFQPSAQERNTTRNKMVESEGQLVLDVYQTEGEIVIKSTLAGVVPEDLDIMITNDMLTIKGLREKDEEVPASDYYYQECYWGPFSRSVILPTEVESDQIKAGLKNGILTIRLPKSEKIKTKKISVIME
jgi:HSP20 family protein